MFVTTFGCDSKLICNFHKNFIAGGLFEGGLFDEAPMGEVPVPEVSSITEQQEAVAAASAAASVHDESDEDMGDHFGGPPSPMGGMRYFIYWSSRMVHRF